MDLRAFRLGQTDAKAVPRSGATGLGQWHDRFDFVQRDRQAPEQ
ncbi:hypothetical protein U0C82_14605 [Fulvimarina sp. 2208YS6-2-32]|uniref:Uncharacterized protein n=1 Tax=Fulvimarina uroteuthidis TaxID=3098149 RepID=A0ABU5I4P7_9HYPH|nr:hypothetical protein [Fulvimarina sp. 2208YS6-2-32]